MSIWKKTAQALAGILAAAGIALASGTWVLPAENDLIAAFPGGRISVSGIGAGCAFLILMGFAGGWIGARNRTDPAGRGFFRFLDGLGFGLLPAACVWKIFESRTVLSRGNAIPGGQSLIPESGLITAEGRWLPGAIEAVLALLLFAAVILWMMLRREPVPENGDPAGAVLAAWGAARIVTEGLRAGGPMPDAAQIAAIAAPAIPTAAWVIRLIRQKRKGIALACVPVYILSVTGILLIQRGTLLTDYPAADLVMQIAAALLAAKAVLCIGRESRK